MLLEKGEGDGKFLVWEGENYAPIGASRDCWLDWDSGWLREIFLPERRRLFFAQENAGEESELQGRERHQPSAAKAESGHQEKEGKGGRTRVRSRRGQEMRKTGGKGCRERERGKE